jgi:hypothetical protein
MWVGWIYIGKEIKIDEGSKWISSIENELLNIISFQIKTKTKTYDSFPFCNLGNFVFQNEFDSMAKIFF